MPEDRDRLFEKALLRHLRAGRPGESSCPDAEQLAAYHQRMLAREEMAGTESHLASCARCREILAQLETSEVTARLEEEPVAVYEEAAYVAMPLPASLAAARVAPISKRRPWWLGPVVPAGAIAAGLVLWIGIAVYRTPPKSEVAENHPEAPAPKDTSDALKSGETQKSVYQEEMSSAPRDARQDQALADRVPAPGERGNLREYSRQAAAPPASRPTAPARETESQAATPAPAAESGRTPPERARAEAQQKILSAAALDGAPTPSQPAKSAPAPAPAPPASPSEPAAKARNQAAPALLEKKDTVSSAFSISAGYNSVAARTAPVRIAAPGGRKIWSVGNDGLIEFSRDGGQTWVRQFSDLRAALTAGSAPSDNVCWIAGAAGTLLRTTDAGQHWQTVATPINDDLGGVQAADGEHASIWDLQHHSRYETSDGGATWKPAADE
jgi:hypothetical protein